MATTLLAEEDVVIVGAGLSGLTAAYHLKKVDPSLKVTVLEAKDRVGGRTLTAQLKTSRGFAAWDLGGQWVARSQRHLLALLEELRIETHRQYTIGKKFQQLGGAAISSYSGNIPSLNILALIEAHIALRKLNNMAASIDMSDPYRHENAEEWDRITLDDFVRKQVWTRSARETLEVAVRASFGVETNQISVLYFLTYGAGTGGFNRLFENVEEGGQEFTIVGGAQQICSMIVDKIGNDTVLLNKPVKNIAHSYKEVVITTEDGALIRARRAIVATPPHQTAVVKFSPPLPYTKEALLNRMPVSHMTKFVITYALPFWREKGLSGEIVSNGGRHVVSGCDSGPVSYACDHTDASNNAALVGFIAGKHALQWAEKSYDDRRLAVLQHLSQFLGPEALAPIEYAEKQWHLEPYNGGCPIYTAPPGVMRYFASGLRDPIGRVHFAGTESATEWCGFMDGAVQTGIRAATEVLHNLSPGTVSDADLEGTAYKLKTQFPAPGRRYAGCKLFNMAAFGMTVVAFCAVYYRLVHVRSLR